MLRDDLQGLVDRLPKPRIQLSKVGAFITARSYDLAGRHIVWLARAQRKGLDRVARALEGLAVPFWQTYVFNWVMGATFALGSLMFVLGSGLSLWPQAIGVSSATINQVFFLGSLPFTVAAYMQLFQAANAGWFTVDPKAQRPATRIAWVSWRPREAGWLSSLTQLLGTLAFNVNTFDAMRTGGTWIRQDLAIWMPDMVGSALFLIAAYLAFIEAGHAYWSWRPRSLDWQIVSINLLGCVAFMVSAVLAYVPRGPEAAWIPVDANALLLVGAACFLVASLLTMRESRKAG